jgi:hypothetical protein
MVQHLFHGDRQSAVIAEDDLGERVADEDEIDVGFIGKAGGGVVVGGEGNDGLVLALLVGKGLDGDAMAEIAGGDAHILLQCGSAGRMPPVRRSAKWPMRATAVIVAVRQRRGQTAGWA